MRKALVLGSVGAMAFGLALTAAPASAACTPSTTATCTVVTALSPTGTLSIVAAPIGTPTFTNVIPTTGTNQSVSSAADLILTTVTDTRLAGTGWSVAANLTDLTPVSGTAIDKSNVALSVPAPTKVLGAAGMSIASLTAGTVPNSSGDIAGLVTASATGGLNTVTYTPHIVITFPAGTPNATAYTTTLTQSVA